MSKETYLVIFDGDCGFCKRTVDLIKKLDWLKKFEFVPFQAKGILEKNKQITKEMCEKEIYLVKPEGKYFGGYDAFKIMTVFMPSTFLISWFFFLPGVTHIGRFVYKLIAKNRHKIRIGDVVCKTDKK